MFNSIAVKYDFANELISFKTHKKIKKTAVEALKLTNGMRVLDLCCGTGDLGGIIKNLYPKCEVYGVDFSRYMLKMACRKFRNIQYYEADALDLPFDDNYFDCVVVGFGLRNISDRIAAIKEIHRVLKSGAKFLHLDFDPKGDYIKLYDLIILKILKVFIKDINPYIYMIKSKNSFYSNDELIEFFEDNGFGFENYKKMMFNMISYQIMRKY